MYDAVYYGIAHIHVGAGHIHLGAEDSFAVLKFAGAHACEKVEVFFYRTVAVGAFLSRLG